jgi:xylobiose transport system substrate-binding protein
MQAAITTFKAHNVIPFALGDSDNWPSLMWLEYLTDRIGGPSVFNAIDNGDTSGWSNPAMTTALTDIQSLIKEGAFGSTFTSTGYDDNAAPTLLGTGKAAMQLMGSWDYSNQLTNHSAFAKNDEAWTTFPNVPGGTGEPGRRGRQPGQLLVDQRAHQADLSTAVAFVEYMASASYEKALLGNGWITTNSNTSSLLPSFPNPAFGQFQFQMVQKAPAFQLSWDQALPTTVGTPLDTEVGKFFAGQVSVSQFESDMASTQKSAATS